MYGSMAKPWCGHQASSASRSSSPRAKGSFAAGGFESELFDTALCRSHSIAQASTRCNPHHNLPDSAVFDSWILPELDAIRPLHTPRFSRLNENIDCGCRPGRATPRATRQTKSFERCGAHPSASAGSTPTAHAPPRSSATAWLATTPLPPSLAPARSSRRSATSLRAQTWATPVSAQAICSTT